MNHSRDVATSFNAFCLALSALTLSACLSDAPPSSSQSARTLEVSPLAPGIWLHTSTRAFGDVVFPSHGLVVEGETSVALIDTGWTPEDTQVLLSWIDEEIGKPINDLIITHGHDDRLGGLEEVVAAGATTHAHALTAATVQIRGLGEIDATFEDEITISRPGLQIEAFYPGPGHTHDNIVAYVPDQEVLFGGCLIRPGDAGGMGNTADADLSQWGASALRAGERFPDAEIVVPSHGAPGDLSLMAHTDALASAAIAAD